jgi:hypothetical protein
MNQQQLDRIEQKLDAIAEMLIAILDQDESDDGEPELDLSGLIVSRPRDENQPL